MKRIASILLMVILFFNWYGYQWMSAFLEKKAEIRLEARLDADNYDESQLISFKIPSTHLSYYNSSDRFERIDGQIEIGGVQYKYVKRRIFNDSLEVLCIPNLEAMQQKLAKNDFFKQVNDIQHNGQGKKSNSHAGSGNNFQTEYYATESAILPGMFYFVNVPASLYHRAFISSFHSLTAEQPPDLPAGNC